MTGAQFFSGLISSNGGNILLAIGEYNGWSKGLTIVSNYTIVSLIAAE